MHYQYILSLKKYLLFFALVVLTSTTVVSQSFNKSSSFKSYWQINASTGTSLFFGDIKQYKIWPVSNYENEWRFAGGLQLVKQISPVFGLRGQALYGKLAGTRREWNRYFELNYFEFNINTTVSLRNIIKKYKSSNLWDAYFILGLGLTNYNTEVKELSTHKVVKKVGYGNGKSFGGRTLQGIMTGGLGFDFKLNSKWNLNIESSSRFMNSDELDGWVNGYDDVYNYTSVGVSYKFGVKNESKELSNEKKESKKSRDYKYFDPKDKKINEAEYDYYGTNPIEPPKVDALVIAPVVAAPVYEEVVEPVEEEIVVVVEEEPITTNEFNETGVEYRVQICAKYARELSINSMSHKYNIPNEQIKENRHNGYYIYTVGSFLTYEQARVKRNQLRGKGITDAFIVAFENGQRLNKLPQ